MPDLLAAIDTDADKLGLSANYTGTRLTYGDPRLLASDASALKAALHGAVTACIADGDCAVIIGGGPLGQAAVGLAKHFDIPIIAPISAAVSTMLELLQAEREEQPMSRSHA